MSVFRILLTIIICSTGAFAEDLAPPVKPPALAKEGNLMLPMVKVWAETDKCAKGNGNNEKEKSIHKYCRELREYMLQTAARAKNGCDKFSVYTMREKCGKEKEAYEESKKRKITITSEDPIFADDIEKDLKARAEESCTLMKDKKAEETCKETLAREEKIHSYQKDCYKCMEGEHLKECLNLEKYGYDRKLKRDIQIGALMNVCYVWGDDKQKEGACNFYRATMLQYEAQADNCKSFRSSSMKEECEKVKMDPSYTFDGQRSIADFRKENEQKMLDYLKHQSANQQ